MEVAVPRSLMKSGEDRWLRVDAGKLSLRSCCLAELVVCRCRWWWWWWRGLPLPSSQSRCRRCWRRRGEPWRCYHPSGRRRRCYPCGGLWYWRPCWCSVATHAVAAGGAAHAPHGVGTASGAREIDAEVVVHGAAAGGGTGAGDGAGKARWWCAA